MWGLGTRFERGITGGSGHEMSSSSRSRRKGEGLPAMRLEVAGATGEEDGGGLGWARVGRRRRERARVGSRGCVGEKGPWVRG